MSTSDRSADIQRKSNWMRDLESFHSRVAATCRALQRFTTAEFTEAFGHIDPMKYGYKSLEDLFVMRGCRNRGDSVYYALSDYAHSKHNENDDFVPPKMPPNIDLETLATSYHSRVDFTMLKLMRFSISDFEKEFWCKRNFRHEDFGYRSVEHVLTFRGCQLINGKYHYDQVYAMKRKAMAVARYFDGQFTEGDFLLVFRRFFLTSKLLKEAQKAGFQSVYQLLKSLPGIEIEEHGDDTTYKLRRRTGREHRMPSFWDDDEKELFKKILMVAATLQNPFSERDLTTAYERRYKDDEPVPWWRNGRLVPFAFDIISGIDYVGAGKYRFNRRIAEDMEERQSSANELDRGTGRVRAKKRTRNPDETTSDDDESVKRARREKPSADSLGPYDEGDDVVLQESRGEIQPSSPLAVERIENEGKGSPEMVEPRTNEGPIPQESATVGAAKEEECVVKGNEKPPLSPASSSISTDPPGTDLPKTLYDHILSLGTVRGQWAEQRLSLITGQMPQTIQHQGAFGITGGPEAAPGCSNAQPFRATSTYEALSELMVHYHNEFLNSVILGALEKGVDPKELGKKFLDCLFS